RGHLGGDRRSADAAADGHRDHHRIGAEDASGGGARGGRRLRGHGLRDRGRDPGGGLRRPGRAGRAGDRRERADALRQEPGAAQDAVETQDPPRDPPGVQRMITKVLMPKLSDAMETGKVIKWLRKEGDAVKGGDVIAEIETDKANVEIEAFGSGVLRKIVVSEGDSVPVGEVIGVIADPSDDIANVAAGSKPATAPPPAAKAPAPAPASKPAAARPPAPTPAAAAGPLPALEGYPVVAAAPQAVQMRPPAR